VLMYFDLWQTTGTFWNCPFPFVPRAAMFVLRLYAFTGIINIQLRFFKIAKKKTVPQLTKQYTRGPHWPECRLALVIKRAHVGPLWKIWGEKLRLFYITVNKSYTNINDMHIFL
jgi:hypothetical protein